jgi:hypothetical protein
MKDNKKVTSLKDIGEVVNATQPEGTAPATGETVPATEPVEQTAPAPASKGFIANMEAILATSKSRGGKGSLLIRPDRGYTLNGENAVKLIGTGITPQLKVILLIFNSALTAEKPVISEPDLHDLLVAAEKDGSLKTKQGAWRVFQFYRTQLIKDKILETAKVSVAA